MELTSLPPIRHGASPSAWFQEAVSHCPNPPPPDPHTHRLDLWRRALKTLPPFPHYLSAMLIIHPQYTRTSSQSLPPLQSQSFSWPTLTKTCTCQDTHIHTHTCTHRGVCEKCTYFTIVWFADWRCKPAIGQPLEATTFKLAIYICWKWQVMPTVWMQTLAAVYLSFQCFSNFNVGAGLPTC